MNVYHRDLCRQLGELLLEDPAVAALYTYAKRAEHGELFEAIFDDPRHYLAITTIRNIDQWGPRRTRRAVEAAVDWLCGVADGPVIALGSTPGRWLYLLDPAGEQHLAAFTGAVKAGYGQRVSLDTGTVAFLPWRTLGDMIADAQHAHEIASTVRRRGRSAEHMHANPDELAVHSLHPQRPASTRTEPGLYRPLVNA